MGKKPLCKGMELPAGRFRKKEKKTGFFDIYPCGSGSLY